MSYLIMEAWLSSFPIPISVVYSLCGMNDSFMNGVGVTSVMCQISISAGIGGQYLPQYNIVCYMSSLITEAWLSSFPMIPISLVYSFNGMNDSFMNGGIGGQYIPQYNISVDIGQCYSVYCLIFCAQFIPIVSQFKNLSLVAVVDKVRVIGKIQAGYTKRLMVQFVSGADHAGERFAWPACSAGLNPIGQLWDHLGRAVRTRATMEDIRQIVVDEWNAMPQQRCSAAHIRYEAVVRGCCCGIWWFHPRGEYSPHLMVGGCGLKKNIGG